MERVRLRHREYKRVAAHDGPYTVAQTKNDLFWECQFDDDQECTTVCAGCKVSLRVCRLDDRTFAAKCREQRRSGINTLVVGVVAVPVVLGALMSALSPLSPPSVVVFLMGLLMVASSTVGAVAGLGRLFFQPQRYYLEVLGESQVIPEVGWQISHQVRSVRR